MNREESPIGKHAYLIEDCHIDYSECDPPGGEYHIPAGSTGVIVSDYNGFACEDRVAVRFFDTPNYPRLWYKNKEIGPGHYINIKKLRVYDDLEVQSICLDINDLF